MKQSATITGRKTTRKRTTKKKTTRKKKTTKKGARLVPEPPRPQDEHSILEELKALEEAVIKKERSHATKQAAFTKAKTDRDASKKELDKLVDERNSFTRDIAVGQGRLFTAKK